LHVYQTFAAGQLARMPLRQSEVDKDPQVRKACTQKVANSMLPKQDRREDWEIYALPPQDEDDGLLFRCIVGRGERTTPLKLSKPR